MQFPSSPHRMTGVEIRAAFSLGSIFALRMFGLFSILPVFAVHAPQLQGGNDELLVGWALGIYGLTQGVLQVPCGMAADRFGRKRVIFLGLLVFAAGSFLAAFAQDIWTVIAGRAIQGAGAISAAVMALAADLTREEQRTKTMAIIGASIGLVFALSLVGSPLLYRFVGLNGIFMLTGVLVVLAMGVLFKMVPPEPPAHSQQDAGPRPSFREIVLHPQLLRLNFGIFALHVAQMAMFVVVPRMLVDVVGLPVAQHWEIYLPVVLLSFVIMLPPLLIAERRGRAKSLFIASIFVVLAVELGYAASPSAYFVHAGLLLAFFVAFNILEASLPSLVSRVAAKSARGTALGIYNTTQALGLAIGGVVGGLLTREFGPVAVFLMSAGLAAIWIAVAAGMQIPSSTRTYGIGNDAGKENQILRDPALDDRV